MNRLAQSSPSGLGASVAAAVEMHPLAGRVSPPGAEPVVGGTWDDTGSEGASARPVPELTLRIVGNFLLLGTIFNFGNMS